MQISRSVVLAVENGEKLVLDMVPPYAVRAGAAGSDAMRRKTGAAEHEASVKEGVSLTFGTGSRAQITGRMM